MIYSRHVAAGLTVALGLSGTAFAAPIVGSDAGFLGNVGTVPSTDLLSTVANGGTVTLSSVFWGNGSGDLASIPFLTTISDTTLTLTPAGLASFAFSSIDGSFAGSASITIGGNTVTPEITGTTGSVASGTETVSLYLVGQFTPAGSTSTFDPDNMSVTLTLNETGITGTTPPNLGTIAGSFTVAAPAVSPPTPPPPPLPEPISVLLLGTGLLGLAAIRWNQVQSNPPPDGETLLHPPSAIRSAPVSFGQTSKRSDFR